MLRTPYQDEPKLKAHISRLAIALEAHAISSVLTDTSNRDASRGVSSGQARDVIWSGKVNTKEEPVMVVEEAIEGEDARDMFVIWRLTAFLSMSTYVYLAYTLLIQIDRPRLRLQTPAIMFKLSASLQSLQHESQGDVSDPYLPSGVPFAPNLLQPLQDDPALRLVQPHPSSRRPSRALSTTRSQRPESLPLKVASRRALRAVAGISARVRYYRSNIMSRNPTVTASLDIEIPSYLQYSVDLKMVDLNFYDGIVEMIAKEHILKLPVKCHSRDNIVYLYHLTPRPGILDGPSAASSRHLDVSLDATVLISDTCNPKIEMRWRTNVDFSMALNSNYNRPGQAMQRGSRPSSLPPQVIPTRPSDSKNAAKLSSDSQSSQQRFTANADVGITITFTAFGDVYVGEPFRWDVFIVNRSNKIRQLAIMAIQKRRKGDSISQPSRASATSSEPFAQYRQIADSVLDENYLYQLNKQGSMETATLVCLTTDTKIGYVAPPSRTFQPPSFPKIHLSTSPSAHYHKPS